MGRLEKNIKVDMQLYLHIKRALISAEEAGQPYSTANDYLRERLGLK